MPETESAEMDFSAAASRPASLWPDSARPSETNSSWFAISRFDPLAEERARLQSQAAATFDVCHPALALRAVLLVQGVLALAAMGMAANLFDWLQRQGIAAFAGVAGSLLWLVAICALRQPLRHRPSASRAGIVLLLGAVSALLAMLPLWLLDLLAPRGDALVLRLLSVALSGAALAAMLWAWLDLRSRIWHPAHASARLAELQSRIRPHFLFNALNSALALVRTDPALAERVLEDLAQLFRVALVDAGASVTLEEEIELARRYLEIEQVRFGSRLKVEWHIDPRVHPARVPPLVLQPLVENAVRHGIEPRAAGGVIAVTARLRRGQVEVSVTNPGDETSANPGHGMALHNLRERLRLLHDIAAQCDAWHEPGPGGGQFHARIVLPAP